MINKHVAAALLAAAAFASPALAQTPGGSGCPYLAYQSVLTQAQWNYCFQIKQDFIGYTPFNKAGDTMQGELITFAASSAGSGFNLQPGVAPTTPNNGDMWLTAAGVFARVNGVTIGPLGGASSASFAATQPLAVTFPAGVTTYALNFNSSLLKDGGNNLGINLANPNTWTATQTFPNNSLTPVEFPTIGANTVLGSIAGGTPAALTQTQLTSLINPATASLSGALPAWPNNTTTFFRGDGTYSAVAFGSLSGTIVAGQFATGPGIVTLAMLNNTSSGAVFTGNATASAAARTDFTLASLTNLASPSATLDLIPIVDHTTGTIKNVTPQAIANSAVAGVTSIAGNSGAFTLGGLLTNSVNLLQVVAAAKTDQQTGTSATLAVTPSQQQQHDSATKAWVIFTGSGTNGAQTINASYNVSGVSRSAAGVYAVSFTAAFATTNYECNVTGEVAGAANSTYGQIGLGGRAAGSVTVNFITTPIAASDPGFGHVECHGRE